MIVLRHNENVREGDDPPRTFCIVPYNTRRLVVTMNYSKIGLQPDLENMEKKTLTLMSLLKDAKQRLGDEAHMLYEYVTLMCFALGGPLDPVGLADDGMAGFRTLRHYVNEQRSTDGAKDSPYHEIVSSFLKEHNDQLENRLMFDVICVALAQQIIQIEVDAFAKAFDNKLETCLSGDEVVTAYKNLAKRLGEEQAQQLQLSLLEMLLPVSPVTIFTQFMVSCLGDILSDMDKFGNTAIAYVLRHIVS